MIALHIMLGNVKILSINTHKGKFGESYNIRIEEDMVLDMEFIEHVEVP